MLAAGGTVLACVPTGGRGRQVVSTQAPVALPPQITVSAILGLDDGALLVATRATAGTGTSGGSEILELQTVRGDGGVEGVVQLRDPDELLPFVIVHELAQSRVMTAADLDIGAMQVADDGTLWLADRMGPFLIHCDASGRVLEPPVSLPEFGRPRALRGPDNPLNERRSALRLMNAVWEHAKAHGGRVAPIVSNHHLLLADDDATTVVSSRESPPGSLPRASSEVFDVESLQAAGFAVIPWTVNEPSRMRQLLRLGVDGIITDRPDLLHRELSGFDADGDGQPGDLLTKDGLVERARFDLQGHRGARGLRPENTLPAMEVALDQLVSTLELDVAVTRDEVPVLSHDPIVNPSHCRLLAEGGGVMDRPVLIRELGAKELAATYVCDRLSEQFPDQINDKTASPVAVAFAAEHGLADPYVLPTLAQVYDFVDFYARYYQAGSGAEHVAAKRRAAAAAQVGFNVEMKTNPAHPEYTLAVESFARAVARVIVEHGAARSNVQSFDFRSNLIVQAEFPTLRTAYLFADTPAQLGYDGANLENSAWRAGLAWAYRDAPSANGLVERGFSGLAKSPDGRRLYPMLAAQPTGGVGDVYFFVYDLDRGAYLPVRHRYRLDEPDAAVADFQITPAGIGIVVEQHTTTSSVHAFSLDVAHPDLRKRRLATRTTSVEAQTIRVGAGGRLDWLATRPSR